MIRSVLFVGRADTTVPAYDQLAPSYNTSKTVPGTASAKSPTPVAPKEATPFDAPRWEVLILVLREGTVGESADPPRSPDNLIMPLVVDDAPLTGGVNDIYQLRFSYG
jgi:hypothetical protein